MPRMTVDEYLEWLARPKVKLSPDAQGVIHLDEAVDREMPLHKDIMSWCNQQWPKWKYVRARSDQASTIAKGAQDFTLFAPGGKCYLIECKTKTGKLSEDQAAWHKELAMLGWTVHVVRSMADFMEVVK